MMESITSSNIETTLPTAKTSSTGPSSNSDTIRHNDEATATRCNQQSSGRNKDTSTTRNNDETTTPRHNQQILEGNENIATRRGNIEETTTNGPASATAVPIIVENPMEVEGMETNKSLDDLGPELAKMGRILAKEITKSLSNALIPLQNDIIQLRADTAQLAQSENKVEELKSENENLHARVCKLELNNRLLKRKLGKLEDRLLDNNLLFSGIKEEGGETKLSRYQILLEIISTTFMGPNYQMQLNQAKQICIEKLVRKGRYAPNRTRPISVTFSHHGDAQDILANKRYLPEGIYVNQEYGEETERERRFLRPILRAATKKSEYRRQCRLEEDHLVIKGKTFTRQNIQDLPENISAYRATSKENENTVGFFGELNPFSNFHRCAFKVNNKWFHSSEQYIQMKKALYFGDQAAAHKIEAADDALECKRISREIESFDADAWNEIARTETYFGISEKFRQNTKLKNTLLQTGDKIIVECSYDKIWGSGIHLNNVNALNKETWVGNNLLGKILMDIRNDINNENDVD